MRILACLLISDDQAESRRHMSARIGGPVGGNRAWYSPNARGACAADELRHWWQGCFGDRLSALYPTDVV